MQSTPNDMVYGECGRFPIYINSQIRCLKYWLKIVHMQDHRLPKISYNMLLHLDNNGKETWASHIRNLLCSKGFGVVWLYQSVGNVNAFLNQFKDRSVCMFKQEWHSRLHDSTRFDLYRQFKSLLEPEKYLSLVITKTLETLISKI